MRSLFAHHSTPGRTERGRRTRITLVLPRSGVQRSSAISMAGAEHLGIGHIASHLRALGYHVTVLNFQLSAFYNAWDGLDDERPCYEPASLAREVLETKPDIVGMCVTAMTVAVALEMTEVIKRGCPGCIVGLGGPHAILCADELFDHFPQLDFVGLNDGERPMALLAEAVAGGDWPSPIPEMLVRGADNRREGDGAASATELSRAISDLTPPARDDLLSLTVRVPINEARITTSRGCNYQCAFCIDALRYGRRWYARNAVQVLDEIESLNRLLGIDHFWISDDNFVTGAPNSQRRAAEIADGLIERGLDVTYRARFRSDTFTANPRLLAKMAESGLIAAFVGLEAGGQKQLDRFNKNTSVKQHRRIIAELAEHDVALQIGFIMFDPYSSPEDLLESAAFLYDVCEMYLVGNFIQSLDVFPGAGITESMRQDGLLDSGFGALSSYDAYCFRDPRIGSIAKYLEEIHDEATITRDKWIYRYRTTMLPKARRVLRRSGRTGGLARWREREDALIARLNDANFAFFRHCVDATVNGRFAAGPPAEVEDARRSAWAVQEEVHQAYAALTEEVMTAAGEAAGRSPAARPGTDQPIPSDMAETMGTVLRALGCERVQDCKRLDGGNLNRCLRFATPEGEFVLRRRSDRLRSEVVDYLDRLYTVAGFSAHGASFSLLNPEQEATMARQLAAAGVRVAEPVLVGADWIVNRFIPGRPLGEALAKSARPVLLLRLLFQLQLAHRAGIVVGDRWGNNEIVDEAGRVHLIDLEIVWSGDRTWLGAADIGVATFGALHYADRPEDIVVAIDRYGVPLLQRWGYNTGAIAEVIDGYLRFHIDPGKPMTPVSPTYHEYLRLVPHATAVRDLLADAERRAG